MILMLLTAIGPSCPDELENTDVNNYFVRQGTLSFSVLSNYWGNVSRFESRYLACELVRVKKSRVDDEG